MLRALSSALLPIFLLLGAAAQAQELSREQAERSLSAADAQARRDAATRLGEVGTMADATMLVVSLRDVDEEVRARAEQAMWNIWARSGNEKVDRLYETGVQQMSAAAAEQGRDRRR